MDFTLSPVTRNRWIAVALSLAACTTLATAQDDEVTADRFRELEAKYDEMQAQLQAMTEQLEQVEFGDIIPEVGESVFGLGPGASKIYQKDQGFSFGGYGEAFYRNFNEGGQRDSSDFLRAVLYTGYKFDDNWVFNSELEFEHATTGRTGSVSVEFAYIENLYSEQLNFRAGILLTPMGFLNEMHEPTTFYGPARPEIEQRIIPSTWRENGAGIHGDLGQVNYKLYLMTGLEASGFTASGLRGGRQSGSRSASEDLAVVTRIDWNLQPGVVVGVSGFYGNSGQREAGIDDVQTVIADVHAEARWRGLRVRALYAHAFLEDTESIFNATGEVVGEELAGYYLEGGYDIMEFIDPEAVDQVIPFLRYETLDTHAQVASGLARDSTQEETVVTVGLQWLPIDQLVFKIAFQAFDENDDRFELGFGYVF